MSKKVAERRSMLRRDTEDRKKTQRDLTDVKNILAGISG